MNELLKFLKGKKGVIGASFGIILPYLVIKGYVDIETSTVISSLAALFLGGASVATKAMHTSTINKRINRK